MLSYRQKSLFVILFLLFSNLLSVAQIENPMINSGEVMKKASSLFDEKKYKEAITELKKIDRSDTNYMNALYEISYNYYIDSQFVRSLEYARLGQKLFPDRYVKFNLLAGSSIDNISKNQESLRIYDSATAMSPNAYLIHYNKGIVHFKMDKFDEAKIHLQKTILINPYFSNAHFYLGHIYMLEGNLVPALLAFKTYLMIAPEGVFYRNVITSMANISKASDEILEYTKKKKRSKIDDFSTQQDILLSKIALDKKYKLKVDLEDNIVRQLQVVDEKLEYNQNDKGFAMQYYVPLYVNTMKDGDFEPMIFLIFSGIGEKKINDWNKKHKKDKEAFIERASAYLDKIKATQILDLTQREASRMYHIYQNDVFLAKGEYTVGKDPNPTGKWEYYHDNGALKAAGIFNEKFEKEGVWHFYYENSQLKEKIKYNNGVEQESEGWYDNGNKWYEEKHVDGKLNGVQKIFYYNGNIRTITIYKDDLRDGEQKSYNNKGELVSIAVFTAGKQNGPARTFFPDGKLKSEVNVINDNEEGTYKLFHANGALSAIGEYKNGKGQGLWTNYFDNGVISSKTVYLDNEITGEFSEYYTNGRLKSKGTYYKKKLDGKYESYDDDGILFADNVYERGRLREVNFYDKAGKAIATTTTRKGAAKITFYTPEGLKSSEGFFDKDGNKEGKFISYFNSGKIEEESNWKQGVQEGPYTLYFQNGKIRKTTQYKDDVENGNVKEYYANGKIRSDGWVIEGNRQQNYNFYNKAGDLTNMEYYLDGSLNGYTRDIYPGNIPNIDFVYKDSWFQGFTQFDTTGKELAKLNLVKGNGTLNYKHYNGKDAVIGTYKNYLLNGPYTFYYMDGSTNAISHYKNGELDSTYKSYYYGGTLRTEGKYDDGSKTGTWKYYHINGKLKDEEKYVDGELEGVNKIYYPDGKLDVISYYRDNVLDSILDIYGEDNNLAVRFNYNDNNVVSYQYEEKPGVLTKPILMPGSGGKVIAKYHNGATSMTATFIDNLIEGERIRYYLNGKVMKEEFRINGLNDGITKSYYPTGKLKSELNFVLDDLHGPCRYYYPDGKIEREENYYSDDKHGIQKSYGPDGKVKQTLVYYYGQLVEKK